MRLITKHALLLATGKSLQGHPHVRFRDAWEGDLKSVDTAVDGWVLAPDSSRNFKMREFYSSFDWNLNLAHFLFRWFRWSWYNAPIFFLKNSIIRIPSDTDNRHYILNQRQFLFLHNLLFVVSDQTESIVLGLCVNFNLKFLKVAVVLAVSCCSYLKIFSIFHYRFLAIFFTVNLGKLILAVFYSCGCFFTRERVSATSKWKNFIGSRFSVHTIY